MGTGFHGWYVMRRVSAEWSISHGIDKYIADMHKDTWFYINFGGGAGLLPRYVSDPLEATPFKTKEAAEARAFEYSLTDPELVHNVKVILK